MLKRLVQWMRNHISKEENELDRKQKEVKELISRIGIKWENVTGILFWDKPLLSFSLYLVFVGLLWKFISYELQRVSLIILLVSALTIVSEIRRLVGQVLTERSFIVINDENKSLGFDLDDVIHVSAEGWLLTESHYLYLLQLKNERNPMLCVHLAIYVSLITIIFKYFPFAKVLFVLGTFLYFYPVLAYIGVVEKSILKLEKFIQPIAVHWVNTQTKRTRNRIREISAGCRSETDDDDEEFLPDQQQQRQAEMIPSHENIDSDFTEDFDPRGKIYENMHEGDSSDYDEDSFLPDVYKEGVMSHDALPSLSQHDSVVEPLDDEFHAGLNFDDVTATSMSDFGIPDDMRDQLNIQDDDDTDDDVDLIPADDFPEDQIDAEPKYAKVVPTGSVNSGYGRFRNIRQQKNVPLKEGDQDFEILDKTELQDVTDEEINEQNTGQQQAHGPHIIKGVSNMLGY